MVVTDWKGFKRINFEFEGMEAILVFPEKPREDKGWLLKTEYFDAFQNFEYEMVKRGWHLAYVQNITRWCADEDIERKKRFVDYLNKEYGLKNKCVPVGMSCGGLIGSKLAIKHPECISVLYLDAPVMNLLSCPAGYGIGVSKLSDEFFNATKMTRSELICYRESPIDHMDVILENKIPVLMVFGDDDDIVPYCENGEVFEKFYRANGGEILAIGKKNCGHHPHGLEDPSPMIEFIEKHCNN